MTIAIREKVAELCGYKRLELYSNLDTGKESFSDSAACALCYMFIHAMEDNPV